MRPLLLAAFALALAAADAPDWVSNRPVEDGVLYGVGQAANADDSQGKAKADISSQLLSSVSSKSVSKQSQKLEVVNEQKTKETKTSFDMETAVSTAAKFLPGAEVAKQQTVGGTVYTLVKLEKAKFVAAAKLRIAELDKPLAKVAGADPDPMTGPRVAALRGCVAKAEERDALALTLAGQGEAVADAPVGGESLRTRLGLLIEPATVSVKGAANAPASRDAVLDVLDSLDITACQNPDEARFELRLAEKGRTQELPPQSGKVWIKGFITGAVTVVRKDTGEVIGSLEASATATDASGSEAGAKAKAREALIKNLGDELKNRLLTILIRGAAE
jgi:hypothetical protein